MDYWKPLSVDGHFNPRAPCGGATVGTVSVKTSAEFQSTRPVRGRDVGYYGDMLALCAISIHAPRAGARPA